MMNKINLSPAQKKSVTISFYLFEKSLRESERLLEGNNEDGFLFYRTCSLDAKSQELLLEKISKTLEELHEIAIELDLVPFEENVEKTIAAKISSSWESLMESRSKRLRGFGEVDPKVKETLDPIINHFAKTALDISKAVVSLENND